jgi:hypothetical protein
MRNIQGREILFSCPDRENFRCWVGRQAARRKDEIIMGRTLKAIIAALPRNRRKQIAARHHRLKGEVERLTDEGTNNG